MVDPRHFEQHAAIYDDARPPYPRELWDELTRAGYLVPGRRVLELGAGSGQATGPLLAAGLHVTAVEPGPQLAARIRAAHPAAGSESPNCRSTSIAMKVVSGYVSR